MSNIPNSGSAAPPPPVWDARPTGGVTGYAGFWLRVVAAIIDGIILSIIGWVVGIFLPTSDAGDMPADPADYTALIAYMEAYMRADLVVVTSVIYLAYFVLQEASPAQATLGKRALGLKVTTVDGARVSYGTAALRAWPIYLPNAAWLLGPLASLVGVAAFIACIVVAFSARKQGLHDMMAGTLVVKTR